MQLRYYSHEMHSAAFVMPRFAQKKLKCATNEKEALNWMVNTSPSTAPISLGLFKSTKSEDHYKKINLNNSHNIATTFWFKLATVTVKRQSDKFCPSQTIKQIFTIQYNFRVHIHLLLKTADSLTMNYLSLAFYFTSSQAKHCIYTEGIFNETRHRWNRNWKEVIII